MRSIEEAVAAKLAAERGGEDALELWRSLWAAFERGGAGGVEAFLESLVELPGQQRDRRDGEGA